MIYDYHSIYILMTNNFHNHYVYGYCMTMLLSKTVSQDGAVDYPLSKVRFHNEASFKASGYKAIRLSRLIDCTFSRTIEDIEDRLSGCPHQVIPMYILWNYTADNFTTIASFLMLWFRVLLSEYNFIDESMYDEYEEWRPYINELNETLDLEPADSKVYRDYHKAEERIWRKLRSDIYDLYIAYHRGTLEAVDN